MVLSNAAALEVGMPSWSTTSFSRSGHCRTRNSSRISKTLRADLVSPSDMPRPLRRGVDMGADRAIGRIDPAELRNRCDHVRQAVLPPGLGCQRRPVAQHPLGNPGVFAVAFQGHAAEQFRPRRGIIKSAFNAHRKRLEILGVVDLDGALRRDDADDHGSILAIIPDIAELRAILRLAFIFYILFYIFLPEVTCPS